MNITMNISRYLRLSAASLLLFFSLLPTFAGNSGSRFEVADGSFLLDGKPFVIKAAELHYPRIPRPYWDQRIKLCKALGMNTICLYTFWNAHEPIEGQFDFSGQNDIAEFIRLCQANDMKVILRPGPYVCAEWEMGGLPWWLLKKKDIRLRENDPYFLERVDLFQKALAEQVAGLTVADGGPVIMVQVENEYGSYGVDKEYVAAIRDMLRANFGDDVALFQCDWSSNFTLNGLDDLLWTMNFGTGADIDREFAHLRDIRPSSPLMCSEFWSGWFDKWGANHETRPAADMIAGIDSMLSKGISFSLYMTHGGTNWGHWAGANSPGFAPDVTSYDYDAPISESGQTTPKYWDLRATLARYSPDGAALPPVPPVIKPVAVKPFAFSEVAPLFSNLPAPVSSRDIMPMESFDQGFGSILYSTSLPAIPDGGATLTVNEPHDFAQVFVDGRLIGSLDRRLGERSLRLPAAPKGSRLDILVEAMGRINFGRAIKDYKGITDNVTVTIDRDGFPFVHDLKNWKVVSIPDDTEFFDRFEYFPLGAFSTDSLHPRLPIGVYRASFNVSRPSDTFLDFSSWGKGLVWVNGHPLGRFWEIGPQQTLYMPGCWLRKGENEIVVLDILGPRDAVSQGLTEPILDKLQFVRNPLHREPGETLSLEGLSPALSASFAPGNGWQQIDLPTPVSGRFVALEVTSTHRPDSPVTAFAELYLLDSDGNFIPREAWSVRYADSEELHGNHTADKTFDLQESTFWRTVNDVPLPHVIVIDLGRDAAIGAIRYLPRMEDGAPYSVRDFNLYVSPVDFSY